MIEDQTTIEEEVVEKKKRRRAPSLTDNQRHLLKRLILDDGYFLFVTRNFNMATVWKLYDAGGAPVEYFYPRTVSSQIRDLLKQDTKGRWTLNLTSVRQLPDNSTLKKFYLEATGQAVKKEKIKREKAERKEKIHDAKDDEPTFENTKNKTPIEYISSSAVIVDNYRYWLDRVWDKERPLLGYIMLNPSTADADKDDQTIKACVRIARSLGYGGIIVGNLFAYRATNPQELWDANTAGIDKVGPSNDQYLKTLSESVDKIVFAWGTYGVYQQRNSQVIRMFPRSLCLKETKEGHPNHPLYFKTTVIPIPYFGQKEFWRYPEDQEAEATAQYEWLIATGYFKELYLISSIDTYAKGFWIEREKPKLAASRDTIIKEFKK